jgi:hypothetical protein
MNVLSVTKQLKLLSMSSAVVILLQPNSETTSLLGKTLSQLSTPPAMIRNILSVFSAWLSPIPTTHSPTPGSLQPINVLSTSAFHE